MQHIRKFLKLSQKIASCYIIISQLFALVFAENSSDRTPAVTQNTAKARSANRCRIYFNTDNNQTYVIASDTSQLTEAETDSSQNPKFLSYEATRKIQFYFDPKTPNFSLSQMRELLRNGAAEGRNATLFLAKEELESRTDDTLPEVRVSFHENEHASNYKKALRLLRIYSKEREELILKKYQAKNLDEVFEQSSKFSWNKELESDLQFLVDIGIQVPKSAAANNLYQNEAELGRLLFFLKNGADANSLVDGTPLLIQILWVKENSNKNFDTSATLVESVRALLSSGASVKTEDHNGESALVHAIRSIQYRNGTFERNIHIARNEFDTPVQTHSAELVQLLLNAELRAGEIRRAYYERMISIASNLRMPKIAELIKNHIEKLPL